MHGWVGWWDAGHVDRLDDEAIATEFFHVVIPLSARPRSRDLFEDNAQQVFVEIPLDRRSVAVGYLRTPSWFIGWMFAFAGVVERSPAWLAIAVALMAIAAVLTFVVGKLPEPERERRRLLKRVTGLGMPPELMSPQMRDDHREPLERRCFDAHGMSWRTAIERGVADELLVAIAEYDRSPPLVARAHRNLIDAEGN